MLDPHCELVFPGISHCVVCVPGRSCLGIYSLSKWLGKLFTGTGHCLAEILMAPAVKLSLCGAFWGVQEFLEVGRLPCGFMSQRSHRWAQNPRRTQGRRVWSEMQRPVLQKADLKLSNSAVGAFAF